MPNFVSGIIQYSFNTIETQYQSVLQHFFGSEWEGVRQVPGIHFKFRFTKLVWKSHWVLESKVWRSRPIK